MSRWDKKCGGNNCPVKYRCQRFHWRNNSDSWWLERELIKITDNGCLYFLPVAHIPAESSKKVATILRRKAREEKVNE